jgi:hypothetical protein
MTSATLAKAQAIIDRCVAIDWRLPSRDAERITAAYRRWLATLGLGWPIRLITDPLDALPAMSGEKGIEGASAATDATWTFAAGNPFLRTMWPTGWPGTAPPALAAEWDVAVAWSFAFILSRASAEELRAKSMVDIDPLLASMSRIITANRANLSAMALLNTPFLGLFDPPSRIVSIVRDLLAVSDDDFDWQHLAQRDRELAGMFNIDIGEHAAGCSRDAVIDALISLIEPMIEACESGAFAHILTDGELVVLASPQIWTDGRRLHRADGPALAWRETKVYAWKGCIVPKRFIAQRASTRPDDIRAVPDQRLRRALVDLYAATHGHRRCMQDFGGVMMHEDTTGRLWCVNPGREVVAPQPGDIKLVEVANGTVEADGSRNTYWLSVPPDMQRAQQAVAWTYAMTAEEYGALVVRT